MQCKKKKKKKKQYWVIKCGENATRSRWLNLTSVFSGTRPLRSSGGGEWWEIILGSATDTQQGWAASGSGCGHPSDSALLRRAHEKKKDKLNGTTMVHASAGESVAAGRVGDRVGLWSMWHSLATLWCWVLLFWSYRRRAAATLREDVEPIHERQHQESWAGIQLHRQTAGRYGIYVHHSG